MTEEALIPKMKRLEKKQRKIKIPLLNFVLIFCCTFLIIAATFVNIDLKHYILPLSYIMGNPVTQDDFIYSFYIIPQIPVIMFVCSVLGKKMAITSTLLYIISGLFFIPVFALGGGLKYLGEYSFGYILSYIPAIIFAGGILQKKYSFKNMIFATIAGVLTIHICGISYMILIALLKHDGSSFISGWIEAQSGLKIIYDLAISFVFVLIGKFLHEAIIFISE